MSTVVLPEQLPGLIAALPRHGPELRAIGAEWEEQPARGAPVLLEFRPSAPLAGGAIRQLIEALEEELDADIYLHSIFYGATHLRPERSLLLELSVPGPEVVTLIGDDALLEAIAISDCPLHSLHTAHEQVWLRKPGPRELPSIPGKVRLGTIVTGAVLFLGLLAVFIPNFVGMNIRAKRAEVPANVDGIKTAELGYEAAFDRFVPQPSFVPSVEVGKGQRDWPDDTAFATIGWAPDGRVRGAYKVDLGPDGRTDFRVTGICDVDGDGERARYTATRSTQTTLITDDDVR